MMAGCALPGASGTAGALKLVKYETEILPGQRGSGLVLGCEDLDDHEHLRHDPVMGGPPGKRTALPADGPRLRA
jgi:hypothetical protein